MPLRCRHENPAGWNNVERADSLNGAAQLALVLEDAKARVRVERLAADADSFQVRAGALDRWAPSILQKILDGGPILPPAYPLNFLERFGRVQMLPSTLSHGAKNA